MKHLKIFEDFDLFEDGYGKNYFHPEKEEKSTLYYFKIDSGEEEKGFVVKIGKNAVLITPEGSENSYASIRIEPISISTMEDHLANDSEYKHREDDIISLGEDELPRVYKILSEAIQDYLGKHPKVSTIYDELLLNLELNRKTYMKEASSMMEFWSYGKWSIQEGSDEKLVIYQKRDHE